jgi:hypothetical protein
MKVQMWHAGERGRKVGDALLVDEGAVSHDVAGDENGQHPAGLQEFGQSVREQDDA